LEQDAKATWKVAEDKVLDLRAKLAAASGATAAANKHVEAAQRLLADDDAEGPLALQMAQSTYAAASARESGLRKLLTEAEAACAPLFETYQQASIKLGMLLQAEEVKHADAELVRAQEAEVQAMAALSRAQHIRAAAWNRAHELHIKQSNSRYREQQARMKAENRPVPGFERVRHAQL
jgi:hypothetical protein